MTLYDFVEMAIDDYYECYVWDDIREENVFKGVISDIPNELLEQDITSWEIYKGRIGLNIN